MASQEEKQIPSYLYEDQFEQAIVSLVITLCQQKSAATDMRTAKAEVANILDKIKNTLIEE